MQEQKLQKNPLVTIFGGSGFLGRHVVLALARAGWRVRVATRRPDLAFHLQPSGGVGQIQPVQANLRYPESLAPALRKADAVVNLVGILRERGAQKFEAVHVEGARAVAQAARSAGISTLIHVSALSADANSTSRYARSKAAGEAAVKNILPEAIILRPSVVFGPEDEFFNRFATMAQISPALPLIGGGTTKLQPVFAGDVGEAVTRALAGGAKAGTVYELGGPEIRSLKEILGFILSVIERKSLLVPIPFPLASLIGGMTEVAMKLLLGLYPETFALTRDQVELLRHDTIVSEQAAAEGRTLSGLGIAAESFETFVPTYLCHYRKTGQYADQRFA
jgi:NADH dehydrogenase